MGYGYSKRSVDVNHAEIRDGLRKIYGYNSVIDTHTMPKFVDIVVGHKGINFLFEIKSNRKKKITDDQEKIKNTWKGQYDVITSLDDAISIIKAKTFNNNVSLF